MMRHPIFKNMKIQNPMNKMKKISNSPKMNSKRQLIFINLRMMRIASLRWKITNKIIYLLMRKFKINNIRSKRKISRWLILHISPNQSRRFLKKPMILIVNMRKPLQWKMTRKMIIKGKILKEWFLMKVTLRS